MTGPKFKIVSQLDGDGVFVCAARADASPRDAEGVYHIPGGCVDVPPPEVPDGQRARWDGKAFVIDPIPAPPPPPPPTAEELAEQARREQLAADRQDARDDALVAAVAALTPSQIGNYIDTTFTAMDAAQRRVLKALLKLARLSAQELQQ